VSGTRRACAPRALAALVFALVAAAPLRAAAERPCPELQLASLLEVASASEGAPPAPANGTFGILPSPRRPDRGDAEQGHIVALPELQAGDDLGPADGEALLVLPKGPNDLLPDGFELGPGARIARSFWSPVLCSTVVHVVGPRDASLAALVPKVPDTAELVPNRRYHTVAMDVRPFDPSSATTGPDPYVKLQHGLARTGVLEGRPALAGAGITVAVLDSAPEVAHRELGHVRVSPLENGPASTPALHGTLIAGVIAAAENNAFGIAGIAPKAEILAIPVCTPLSPKGTVDQCQMADLLRGLDEAWKQGARVVNLALVGPPDPVLERAVNRMRELGVVLVAAAGNDGRTAARYPAAYPSVLGVGAVEPDGKPWPRSNHGPWVSILAPGTEILSTTPGNAFAFGDGSSLAAAHVAGLLTVAMAAADTPEAARLALLEAARGGHTPIDAAYVPPARVTPSQPMPRLCEIVPLLGRACPPPARQLQP
jgi:subtilisin family serine protease